MQFSILRKELKAISRFSATKDIRYYICGVHVVQNNRGTYVEATNGHMLGRLLIDDAPKESAQVTIPNDAIKALSGTAKQGDEWLHFTIEGVKISVLSGNNTYTFQALDGTFPDCDRVLPLVFKAEEIAPAAYNPEYLMAFQQASQDIKNTRKGANCTLSILQRGNLSGIVNIGVDNFVGVVMPYRDGVGATVPSWCYQPTVKPSETYNADGVNTQNSFNTAPENA